MPFRDVHALSHVFLELTAACNLRCDYCPITRKERPTTTMSTETACSVVAQLAALGHRGAVYCNVLGEPLLHPGLAAVLRAIREHGMQSVVMTNGVLLPQQGEMLRRLADQVTISIHHYGTVAYRGAGAPADWATYYRGITEFITAVIRDDRRTVGAAIRLHAPPDRFPHRGAYSKTVRDGVMQICADLALAPPARLQLHNRSIALGPGFGLEFSEIVDWNLEPKRYMPRFGTCTNWGHDNRHFAILADGRVVLCCTDYCGATSAGNISSAPLAEILTGESFRTWNEGLQRCRLLHPACRACRGAGTLPRLLMRSVHGLQHHWRRQRGGEG